MALYGVPTIPTGTLAVVIVNGPTIVIDRFAVTASGGLLESCTWTVKREMPAAAGVPVIAPLLLIDKPLGREPAPAIEKVYDPMPPLAVTIAV